MKFKQRHFFKTITNSQRKGIFVLLVVIIIIQVSFYLYKKSSASNDFQFNEASVVYYQNQIDSLKQIKSKTTIYPFNPNYINDKKGYFLKMHPEEIDKLLAYRNQGKFVNSAKEFQKVTGVSDQWLNEYQVYFKFPEWTQNKKQYSNQETLSNNQKNTKVLDINKATISDLVQIRGIGPTYAERIISERDKFDGFVHINQLNFIYGIPPEAIAALKEKFAIQSKPTIQKININTASKLDLSKIPYISSQLAREILIYRSKSEEKLKIEDMKKISGFPLDKLNIITLYLDF